MQDHVILIGFKHAGKTSVGRELAVLLARPFIDLDDEIERRHQKSCRTIMKEQGQAFFRELEREALRDTLEKKVCVMALGGGAPLSARNQALLLPYTLVHVTASPDLVFDRIMAHGRPAFFPDNEDPQEAFKKLWEARDVIYRDIADFSVQNDGEIIEAAQAITKLVKERA